MEEPGAAPQALMCAHCGQECESFAAGASSAPVGQDGRYAYAVLASGEPGGEIRMVRLCHPNEPARRDCYREITVWQRRLGDLR